MNIPASIQTFLTQNRSSLTEGTLEAYGHRLNRFAEFAKQQAPSPKLILEYRASLADAGLKESHIAGVFACLKLFLNWAVKMELLGESPMPDKMRFVVPPCGREPITALEFALLLAHASHIKGYEFWPDALNVGWHTGLRLCDVALMQRVSLNVQDSAVKLIPKKTKRYLRIVDIPVPVELIHRLAARSEGEDVFPEMATLYRGDRHKSLSAQFCYIARRAGVKDKGFHSFRRAAITRWLEDGVSPALVSDMTGINLSQIMTYMKPSLESKREALGLTRKETAA